MLTERLVYQFPWLTEILNGHPLDTIEWVANDKSLIFYHETNFLIDPTKV